MIRITLEFPGEETPVEIRESLHADKVIIEVGRETACVAIADLRKAVDAFYHTAS